MIHSFRVTIVGLGGPGAKVAAAPIFGMLADWIARTGGAGASAAGDPADDGVDTAGEAILLKAQLQRSMRVDKANKSVVDTKVLGLDWQSPFKQQTGCRKARREGGWRSGSDDLIRLLRKTLT